MSTTTTAASTTSMTTYESLTSISSEVSFILPYEVDKDFAYLDDSESDSGSDVGTICGSEYDSVCSDSDSDSGSESGYETASEDPEFMRAVKQPPQVILAPRHYQVDCWGQPIPAILVFAPDDEASHVCPVRQTSFKKAFLHAYFELETCRRGSGWRRIKVKPAPKVVDAGPKPVRLYAGLYTLADLIGSAFDKPVDKPSTPIIPPIPTSPAPPAPKSILITGQSTNKPKDTSLRITFAHIPAPTPAIPIVKPSDELRDFPSPSKVIAPFQPVEKTPRHTKILWAIGSGLDKVKEKVKAMGPKRAPIKVVPSRWEMVALIKEEQRLAKEERRRLRREREGRD